jgi:hypothetical protein
VKGTTAALVLGITLTAGAFGGEALLPVDCPFAAHNAYPYLFLNPGGVNRALSADMPALELDLTYDPVRRTAVVTHDGSPRGGEPALRDYLQPVWKQWLDSQRTGFTLILDFKSSKPELAHSVARILEEHRSNLSSMVKSPGARFEPGRITVCLTGSGAGHRAYAESVAAGGRYIAFGDSGSEDWKTDPREYVPAEPAGFIRFLTFERRVFLSGPDKRRSADVSIDRLREVVRLADERGYRIRVYTVNAQLFPVGVEDVYWKAAVEAGVHMVATDDYELARQWWNRRRPAKQ